MIAVDGKCCGLFVVRRGVEGAQAFQIVGQLGDGFICRPMTGDGAISAEPCFIVIDVHLFEATKDGTAEFYADDRGALRRLKALNEVAALAKTDA